MGETLGALLTRVAGLGSARPAVTCDDRTLTFGDLNDRSSRVANALIEEGVRPGDRVGVLMRNTPEFFELLFGAARCGAALVGLNWRLAGPEIEGILADSGPSVLVVGAAQRALVPPEFKARVIELETGYEAWIADVPATVPDVEVQPEAPVLQLYSSGTTGAPKGAVLTHANLAYTPRMGNELYGMSADSVNFVASPLFHIGGAGYGLTALGQGGHTVLVADLKPAAMLRAIESHRVTHTFVVPAVVQMLVDAPGVERADLSSLQLIAYGGAPMNEPLLLRAISKLGCGFMAVYGMTETAGTVLALAPDDHDPGGPRAGLLRSVGRPLPWHEVSVFDPATGTEAPAGAVGEIWVRSGQNMAGYWHQPEETARTLTAEGWLRTGDAAYHDAEGFIFLHDRIKDMIISGGENVYPAEVENALAGHPAIVDLAVIGVPSERWGETVKAIVVRAPNVDVDPTDIIAYARDRLARYKCPTSVDFIDELPRNASGKIMKKVLRDHYRPAPVPDPAR
jgi:long-chain acyl-CoA synthetase